MLQMIERALEAKREQHRAQMAREREEITAQVTVQVVQQVADQMAMQIEAYETRICVLVEGSKVVTSESEVTNVIALTCVIYRSSVDN
jgi:hypothetical protein